MRRSWYLRSSDQAGMMIDGCWCGCNGLWRVLYKFSKGRAGQLEVINSVDEQDQTDLNRGLVREYRSCERSELRWLVLRGPTAFTRLTQVLALQFQSSPKHPPSIFHPSIFHPSLPSSIILPSSQPH